MAVAAALLTPIGAASAERKPYSPDLLEVRGTIRVLAGEGGTPDVHSLELPSGRLVRLAPGFEADPGSLFVGKLEVPEEVGGALLSGRARDSALARAAGTTGLSVRDARVADARPATGPANHTTYVAKLTNLGGFTRTDADMLAQIAASQAYWVREAGGMIPAWTTATGVVPVSSGAASVAGGCGLGAGGAQFDAIYRDVAAQAFPGVDFSGDSPNHLVVVVPNACANSEAAGRGGLGTSFGNGGPVILRELAGREMQTVLDHEYGHNVGLEHSNNARAEYGGVYEVMGAGPGTYANAVLGTIYRWENGVVAAGETVDANEGGQWTLAPRSATSGLRSAVFIDPDTGLRYFVDNRNGSGADAGATYAAGLGQFPTYGQSYARGLVLERENKDRGSFLQDVPGGDGALQAGETWTNAGGSISVRAVTADTVQVTRVHKPALPAGGVTTSSIAVPFREVYATATVAGATRYRYQWYLNGQPIPQADESKITPTLAMVGGLLTVKANGYAVGRDPSPEAQSAPVQVGAATWHLPTSSARSPLVSGRAKVGHVLTATSAVDWVNWFNRKPAGFTVAWQWMRGRKAIAGATGQTYQLRGGDFRERISVRVIPVAPGYDTGAYAQSASTDTVAIGRLRAKRPKIVGKPRVGKRLKVRTKGWTAGTRFKYRWFANGRLIKGAKKKKLVVTRSMRRKKITVKVTGRNAGYRPKTKGSKPVRIR